MKKLIDELTSLRRLSKVILDASNNVSIDTAMLERVAPVIARDRKITLNYNPIAASSLPIAQRLGLTLIFSSINYCYVDPDTGHDYIYKKDGEYRARSTAFVLALIESGAPWDDFAAIAKMTKEQWKHILHLDGRGVVLYDASERIERIGRFAKYLDGKVSNIDGFFEQYPNAQAVYCLLFGSGLFEDMYLKRLQVAIMYINDIAKHEGIRFDAYEKCLTIMADYRLPQVLMEYGVIRLSPDAVRKLESRLTDPELENAIRAATLIACYDLSNKIGIPEVQIDRILWNKSQSLIASGNTTIPAMRVATRCY
jgi:hypothetical protein